MFEKISGFQQQPLLRKAPQPPAPRFGHGGMTSDPDPEEEALQAYINQLRQVEEEKQKQSAQSIPHAISLAKLQFLYNNARRNNPNPPNAADGG